MKNIPRGLFLVLLLIGCSSPADEITTFILVRHAEKGNDGTDDPDLTDEGKARAENLLTMFKDTPLAAVYSTKYKRTKNTVWPIAEIQNLEIQEYEAFKPDIIENMVNKHRGATVLISGHSNTTPWTANFLVGRETFKDYAETEYGIILIVAVAEVGGVTSVTRVNY